MVAGNPDRRDTHRAEVLGDLFLEISHEKSRFNGDAMNLSVHGINFLSLLRVPLFREVDVRLRIPSATDKNQKKIHCHGVVVRCVRRVEPFYEISLFFMDLRPADKRKITNYVEQVATQKPLGPR